MGDLKSIIESLAFLNGEPLKIAEISKGLGLPLEDIENAVNELVNEYKNKNCGIKLIKLEDCIQMCTNPENEEAVMNFFNPVVKKDLSSSALETLSIVAYKQPITRVEIEEIRKVQCSYVLKFLQSHDLIKVVGKKNTIGHPSIYGTTDEFLRMVGIESLSELPKIEDDNIVTSI